MKRLLLVLSAVAVALVSANLTGFAALTQDINQHPVGGSGIQGRVEVTDTGSSLIIHAVATGLNPAHAYFSLIYTLGSHPGGISESTTPQATSNALAPCADLNQAGNSTITVAQMLVGFWTVNPDGTGTLDVAKSATGNSQEDFWPAPFVGFLEATFGFVPHSNSYAPIGTWSTMSIRDANLGFALQACGEAQGTGSGHRS